MTNLISIIKDISIPFADMKKYLTKKEQITLFTSNDEMAQIGFIECFLSIKKIFFITVFDDNNNISIAVYGSPFGISDFKLICSTEKFLYDELLTCKVRAIVIAFRYLNKPF